MIAATVLRWSGGDLVSADARDESPDAVLAADSWLVRDGSVLALELHRDRFGAAVSAMGGPEPLVADLGAFWAHAIAALPHEGWWFPRVELVRIREAHELRLLLRPAPEPRRDVALATHAGTDPRTVPAIKGPDLENLERARTQARTRGADEAVIVDARGTVVDGCTTAIAWWHGDALAIPEPELERVDSVTLRCLLGVATALGIDILHERVPPTALDGREVWALNALHGIRIVTHWVDGPRTAEEPGRLATWRRRLDALRRPLTTERTAHA